MLELSLIPKAVRLVYARTPDLRPQLTLESDLVSVLSREAEQERLVAPERLGALRSSYPSSAGRGEQSQEQSLLHGSSAKDTQPSTIQPENPGSGWPQWPSGLLANAPHRKALLDWFCCPLPDPTPTIP